MTINEQIVWSVILIISVAINIVQYYNTHHMKEIRKENKWNKD